MAEGHLQAKLFRQQAIAGARQRALGEVVLALPPRAPVAAGVAALACTLLVAGTGIVRVPERIPAAGVLQPAGRIIPVLAPRAGIVAALRIADGERVRAGERLLDIRAAGADAPDSVLAAERRSVERELAALADEAAADALAYRAAAAAAERQLAGSKRRRATAAAEAQLLAERADIATRRLERARRVHAQGGLAEHQLDALAAEAVEARVASTAALARRNAVDDDAGVLMEEQRQTAAQREQRRFALEREQHRLERELLRLEDRTESAVPAPTGGTAGALLVGDGSPVQQGQLLLQLFAAESALEAHLYVAADHAGRVRKGQVIALRLRAWPYALYGTLEATVTAVSPVPVPAASLPGAPPGGAVFEVRARPDARDRANWPSLGAGATFDVDIITRRWPLHHWLLRGGRPGG